MNTTDDAIRFAAEHEQENLDALKELLAIPSVSTLPEHQGDMERAARWLADALGAAGMERAEVMPTPGHPVVYAERLGAPGKPTVLVYGHYDVQPVDPVAEWETPPFEPIVRDANLYARGASDMKGQVVAQLKAVEALAAQGALPVNLKYLLEGEEEIGSPNLEQFIRDNRDLLAADVVLNCDAGIQGPDTPSIVYALRGLAYFELEVRGPRKDLHSGLFGGAILNPIQALCEMLAGLHDEQGRVTLPGFYDDVRPLDDDERRALARNPGSDEDWLALTGAPALWGEEGYTTTERIGARPSLDINGILGGFTGEGSKTVLPARAMVKLSTRLVADQDETRIRNQLLAYLERNAPEGITWELREHAHGPGALMDRESRYMHAAVRALRETFGKDPLWRREGGSVPVVGMMQRTLGLDSVMLGFALPDDGIHGPNEKQHVPTFHRGIAAHIRYLANLGLEAGEDGRV